jgi:hypothetical protein
MRFPVLVGKGRKAEVTRFIRRPRPQGCFVMSDDLALGLEGGTGLLDFFVPVARRFFPQALAWQVDWPADERATLASALDLRSPWRLDGDSWLLPLFFALACLEWSRPWPEGVLASGAVRRCRGLRCASIGGAVYKARRAATSGKLCFLPKSNITRLRSQGADVSHCIALPFNMTGCLDIWRRHV